MRAPQRAGERFGRPFWERLWRSAGIQSAILFVIAACFFGYQPPVGELPWEEDYQRLHASAKP